VPARVKPGERVFQPAAIYGDFSHQLCGKEDASMALVLTEFLVIVSVLDNILKSIVMGRGLTTPSLAILIGVIGGTLAHGIIGLVIGPIILSVAWN
jgi:predicted PurR-regulated permease PerM